MDRLYSIAQTGQTAEPTAVDNIMAQYQMQQQAKQEQPKQEQGGFWNGLKNFAGSNTGRMLLGGLAGAAVGGLTGRSGKEALLGGLAGITGAAEGITSRNKYLNNLAEKRQERADRMAEAEKLRQHQLTMQANTIQANKDAADLEFEREMEKINEGRFYNEQQKTKGRQEKIDAINSNPYLSDEQKAWQIAQIDIPEFNNDAYYGSMLVRDPNNQDALNYFTNKAKLNSIINPKTPTSAFSQDLKTLTEDYGMPLDKALDYLGKRSMEQEIGLAGGKAEAEARGKTPYTMAIDNNKSQNALSNDITMAGINHKNNVAMEGLKHDYNVATEDQRHNNAIAVADNKLKNDMLFENYKRNLPPEKIIEAGYIAQSLQKDGYDVTAGDILYQGYKKDVLGNANTVANIGQTLASTDKTKAEIPFVPQKMTADIAHTKSQTAKNMYDVNPVQPGTVVNGVTLTGNKTYDTEALKQKAKNESEREKSQLARTRAETQAIEGIKALQQLVDDDSLGNFNQSSWNIYPSDATRLAQGKLAGAIAAIAPLAIQRLKDSGVSGVNTIGEFMTYVGLPENPTSKQIEGALPLIMSSIGMTDTGYQSTDGSNLSSVSTDDLVGML